MVVLAGPEEQGVLDFVPWTPENYSLGCWMRLQLACYRPHRQMDLLRFARVQIVKEMCFELCAYAPNGAGSWLYASPDV